MSIYDLIDASPRNKPNPDCKSTFKSKSLLVPLGLSVFSDSHWDMFQLLW